VGKYSIPAEATSVRTTYCFEGMLIRNEFSSKEKIEKVKEEQVIPSDKLLKLLERQ
jgi:hypothetical protein